jgi:hypothetical protein
LILLRQIKPSVAIGGLYWATGEKTAMIFLDFIKFYIFFGFYILLFFWRISPFFLFFWIIKFRYSLTTAAIVRLLYRRRANLTNTTETETASIAYDYCPVCPRMADF